MALAPPLADLAPMNLTERKTPFSSPDWIFELKFDGYRVLAEVDAGQAVLKTRNGAYATKWFPEVVAGLQQVKAQHGRIVIDGEACVLDDIGRSDFNRLQDRARRRRWYDGADPVTYCAFDLLVFKGEDIRSWPVERRKAQLAEILEAKPQSVLYVQHIEEQGEALYQQLLAAQLEGIVAKRLGSVYLNDERTADWLKVKRPGAVPAERFKR
jgi:bifunctional non-homologous end joining protein LigD